MDIGQGLEFVLDAQAIGRIGGCRGRNGVRGLHSGQRRQRSCTIEGKDEVASDFGAIGVRGCAHHGVIARKGTSAGSNGTVGDIAIHIATRESERVREALVRVAGQTNNHRTIRHVGEQINLGLQITLRNGCGIDGIRFIVRLRCTQGARPQVQLHDEGATQRRIVNTSHIRARQRHEGGAADSRCQRGCAILNTRNSQNKRGLRRSEVGAGIFAIQGGVNGSSNVSVAASASDVDGDDCARKACAERCSRVVTVEPEAVVTTVGALHIEVVVVPRRKRLAAFYLQRKALSHTRVRFSDGDALHFVNLLITGNGDHLDLIQAVAVGLNDHDLVDVSGRRGDELDLIDIGRGRGHSVDLVHNRRCRSGNVLYFIDAHDVRGDGLLLVGHIDDHINVLHLRRAVAAQQNTLFLVLYNQCLVGVRRKRRRR